MKPDFPEDAYIWSHVAHNKFIVVATFKFWWSYSLGQSYYLDQLIVLSHFSDKTITGAIIFIYVDKGLFNIA